MRRGNSYSSYSKINLCCFNYFKVNEIIELFREVVKSSVPSGLKRMGPAGAPIGPGLYRKYPPGGLLGTTKYSQKGGKGFKN